MVPRERTFFESFCLLTILSHACPQLYPSCHWEDKAIRRLIGDGRIAARLKGSETRTSETDQECPICFLNYTEINITKCCQAVLCTECYLQVKPQKDRGSCCPFCNHSKLSVSVAQLLDKQEIMERQKAEERAKQAHSNRLRTSSETKQQPEQSLPQSVPPAPDSPGGFGSSLEQNHRVALLRARSESMNSEPREATAAAEDLSAVAMTPDERRQLEAEMRSQHSHPLAQRLQAEESQRRMQNEIEYLRNRRRGPRNRDWNRIVDAFENGGNGQVQSLDDLVVLEAAIMLSMQEEEERRGESTASGMTSDNATAAAPTPAPAAATESSFDAAQHASRGFPLARQRVQQAVGRRPRSDSSALEQETQTMVARGMSEEEQLAMAIAASLEERGESSAPSSAPSNNGSSDE